MSQTVTTLQPFVTCCPLSPSLSNPHPPSVADNTLSLYLLTQVPRHQFSHALVRLPVQCLILTIVHNHSYSHSHSHLRTDNHTETCSVHSPPIIHTHLMSACHVTDSCMRSRPRSFTFSFAHIHFHIHTLTVVPRLAGVAHVHTNKPDAHIGVRVHRARVCALDLTCYTLDFVHFRFDIAHALCSHWLDMRPRHSFSLHLRHHPIRHVIAITSSFLASMSRD